VAPTSEPRQTFYEAVRCDLKRLATENEDATKTAVSERVAKELLPHASERAQRSRARTVEVELGPAARGLPIGEPKRSQWIGAFQRVFDGWFMEVRERGRQIGMPTDYKQFGLPDRSASKGIARRRGSTRTLRKAPQRYAFDDVAALLGTRTRGSNLIAVDDGICLHYSCPMPVDTRVVAGPVPTEPDPVEEPGRDLLARLMDSEEWLEPVAEYLRTRLDDVDFNCRWKVGLRRIRLPQVEASQPLRLTVAPLLWAFSERFNREILRALRPDVPHADDLASARAEALELRDRCRLDLLDRAGGDCWDFPFPSILHLELAVVSSDRMVLIVEKHGGPQGEMARSGRPVSCTVEKGLNWNDHVHDGAVDLAVAARDALDELGLPKEVAARANVTHLGVALEGSHLNSAVIGVAQVGIAGDDLREHALGAHEGSQFTGAQTVSLTDAHRILDGPWDPCGLPGNRPPEHWHTTGRLRVLLTLVNRGLMDPP
jgi:hypothetical protein